MINLPLGQIAMWTARAAQQDPEALAFLSSLFPETEACFLCDTAVGAEGCGKSKAPQRTGWRG